MMAKIMVLSMMLPIETAKATMMDDDGNDDDVVGAGGGVGSVVVIVHFVAKCSKTQWC